MTLNAKTCSHAQRVLNQTVRHVTHARHDSQHKLSSPFASHATVSGVAEPGDGRLTNANPNTVQAQARRPLGREAKQKEADREFFADLLSSAATKRDAKAYISRLKAPPKSTPSTSRAPSSRPVVNLGNLFPGSQAAFRNPTFTQGRLVEEGFHEEETLHVALVKINDVKHLPENVLLGIGETLSQLNRLSISPCVFVEATGVEGENWKQEVGEQVDKLVAAIGYMNDGAARRVDNVFVTSRERSARVANGKLLLRPLRRGQVPVVGPFAYQEDEQRFELIDAKDAVIALSKEFAGLNFQADKDTAENQRAAAIQAAQQQISLDRIITIDSAGGTSNPFAPDHRDVFINLEQEYQVICERLSESQSAESQQQLSNLDILHQSLQFLPPTSSGLMTTHVEAANSAKVAEMSASSVGTRRQKNALIHNLLTDKPAYSSSLPAGRLNKQISPAIPVSTSSFVKKGMPLTILPDPRQQSWTPIRERIKLTDPRIDLARLVYLIEDSFNRKLDVEHYMNRVNDRIAGVIIAGEYEGGALLTWEDTPNATGSLVPYLDKFAVLKRSQGAGGVADVVFNAMVRTCFPNGVCWRSRKDNPVNKWYFERSRGTWKIPDMNWTMFWTTPGVEVQHELFKEYESVCRGVLPSWADQKAAD